MKTVFLALFLLAAAPAHAGVPPQYASQPANQLTGAPSPYLVIHSHDLVNWRPWNAKTLKLAKKAGKPVFLSVGYSACHWCHVMQEESFNNPAIAKIINENFTPILVDREARPDLDETYMLATEAISGRGGWPNNVFLTPDLKPFYANVYFPPDAFRKVLNLIATDWQKDASPIEAEAERIAIILSRYFSRKAATRQITPRLLARTADAILGQYDEFNGGIGTAPKYFHAPVLSYLAFLARNQDNTRALAMFELTLKNIAAGGVRDQLAGGFYRYATDAGWRIPHFEKMLYDQAQLASLFTTAHELTGKQLYARIARSTLDYVLADLRAPDGGFYATRDADSEGKEGAYYLWTPEQLTAVLGGTDAQFILNTLGLLNEGGLAGKVILYDKPDLPAKDRQRLKTIFTRLLAARKTRIAPARDEKIITGWNGLMITALAGAARRFKNARYRSAAIKAAKFIWTSMRAKDGTLYRVHFRQQPHVPGTLDDYAQAARAFIAVYDLTDDDKWLKRAQTIAADMDALFLDKTTGDYFFTTARQGYTRIKLRTDTDTPSGNASALDVHVRLSKRSLNPDYARRAESLIAALSGIAVTEPQAGAAILQAAASYLFASKAASQYSNQGRVKATASLSPDRSTLTITMRVAPGWHINAHRPLEDRFIATDLKIDGKDATISWPEPVIARLGFNEKDMALLENTITITARLASPATGRIMARLTIQPCNDQLCLLPQTLTLGITPPD